MSGCEGSEGLFSALGKHRRGKGCLYVKRLADVQLPILEKLIAVSFAEARRRYPEAGRGA